MNAQKILKLKRALVMLFVPLCLLTFIFSAVSHTLAYMSDKRTVVNIFTFGDIQLQLLETPRAGGGGSELLPGATVAKDPAVKNTGSVPCYVRATVVVSDALLGKSQSVWDFLEMGELHEDWTVGEGSWGSARAVVYYNEILDAGEVTPAIFSRFTLREHAVSDGSAPAPGANNKFGIRIIVEAVQTKIGNDSNAVTFSDAQDAFTQLMP